MKKTDLDKHLDNLIIDGLIKEAEQDNADFEAAMRQMSIEELAALIYESAYVNDSETKDVEYDNCANMLSSSNVCWESRRPSHIHLQKGRVLVNRALMLDIKKELSEEQATTPEVIPEVTPAATPASKWKVLRPWIASVAAAAAIILIVLLPSINSMNGKLCDSVLYASTSYITSSRSANHIYGLSEAQLKAELPLLEERYNSIQKDGTSVNYTDDLKVAGWDLTVAYLRLHKKGDAVNVLIVLSDRFNNTPFGNHCRTMLEQLR